jgi:dienelactone hydrolase
MTGCIILSGILTCLVSGVLVAAATAPGQERFEDLRRPPTEPHAPVSPPWAGLAATAPDSGATWAPTRSALERRWRELMGPFPQRVPLAPRELAREELADHTRVHLRFTADGSRGPDSEPEAYLLLPRTTGKHPGAVVLHQTTDETIRQAAGLSGREAMHLGLHLVRRGFVCIVPRNFLWCSPGTGYQQLTESILAREWPDPTDPAPRRWRTGMAKMTWDAIRATDYLVSRPEVDAGRILSIGHSLGGKEVLYHAAFDPRIRAAVSCEGGIGLRFSNWDAVWYLGKQINAPEFKHDHQELLSLVAPRAFLLIGGESADGAKSWPFIEAALPVWRAHGAEERVGLLRHPAGHDFPHPGPDRERVWAWIDHQLSRR